MFFARDPPDKLGSRFPWKAFLRRADLLGISDEVFDSGSVPLDSEEPDEHVVKHESLRFLRFVIDGASYHFHFDISRFVGFESFAELQRDAGVIHSPA